jgi:type I restriction enzyme R subunit
VLDKYVTEWEAGDRYQSESELERELIQDLRNQGYEFVPDLTSSRRCWPMSGAASDTESGGV